MATTTKDRLPKAPRLLIEVGDEDVNDAVQNDSGRCMIAEAIKRQLPEGDRKTVTVDLQTIRFSDSKKRVRYWFLTPPVAQDALIRFDQGEPVEPIAFRLRGGNVSRMTDPHRSETEIARRAARKAELEAKEAAGELDSTEKRSLTMFRKTDQRTPKRERVTIRGPRRAVAEDGTVVIKGGRIPPKAVLGHSRARFRKYGLRSLKPPRAGEGQGLIYARRERDDADD